MDNEVLLLRTDLDQANALLRQAVDALGPERVWVAPSCSLLHVPVDLSTETQLESELRSWMAFAKQKLGELRALADAAGAGAPASGLFTEARAALESRRRSPRTKNRDVRGERGAGHVLVASVAVVMAVVVRLRHDRSRLASRY